MSKVTSKLQVTVPKAIAEQYGIRPGDSIEWLATGDVIRIVSGACARRVPDVRDRLKLFDQATARQRGRQARRAKPEPVAGRGWKRVDVYRRGRAG